MGSVHPFAYVPLWCLSALGAILVLARALMVARLRREAGGEGTITAVFGQPLARRHGRSEVWHFDLARPAIPHGPLLLPGVLFAALALVQVLPLPPHGHPLTASVPDSLRGLAFLAAALGVHLMAGVVLDRSDARRRLRRVLTILGLVLSVVALSHEAAGARRIYGFFEPWEGTPSTLFGPFVNRNHLAGYLLMLVPVSIAWLRRSWLRYCERVGNRPNWRRRVVALGSHAGVGFLYATIPAVATVGTLLATTSRGGILALIGAGGLSAVASRRKGVAPLWAYGIALLAMALSWFGVERLEQRFRLAPDQAPGRTVVWEESLRQMRGRWLTGVGFNTYGVALNRVTPWNLPVGATPWPPEILRAVAAGEKPGIRSPAELSTVTWYREAHCDYLQVLVETGVPGLVLALWAALAVLARARSRPWLLAAVAGVLLHVVVDFDLQIPAIAVLFSTLAAWPPRRRRSHRSRLRDDAAPASSSGGPPSPATDS